MHQYIKTIGFDNILRRSDEVELIDRLISESDGKRSAHRGDKTGIAVSDTQVAEKCGVTVVGYMTDSDFIWDYYYPYVGTDVMSDRTACSITLSSDGKCYYGSIENDLLGVTTIFFLTNFLDVISKNVSLKEKTAPCPVYLTAMAETATALMPMEKSPESDILNKGKLNRRNKLLEDVKNGSEEAMGELTFREMLEFKNINKKVMETDIYSAIDTFFVPYGVECDIYSIMGEILEIELLKNRFTGGLFYRMKITANNITLTLAVARDRLVGEPSVGMRIKAHVWLTGKIEF